MERRTVLAGAGIAFATPFAGCLADSGSPDDDEERATTGTDGDGIADRVKAYERAYIRDEVVTRDDETIDSTLRPVLTDTEARDDGKFVGVRTEFGSVREADDEPDEHVDYLVTASYLVSDEAVYRTEGTEAEGDPRNGTRVG